MGANIIVGADVTKDRPIESHPFIRKLSANTILNAEDLKALGRILGRSLAVKKGQDIVVQGYEYKELDIVESGVGIRYILLHKGGRQIVNMALPGDIVGLPTSFFGRSMLSVMAETKMSIHRISFDKLLELCRARSNIAVALIWYAAREASIYAHHLVNVGRRSPLERMAYFLLEMHTRFQAIRCATDNTFELPLSQQSIGDAVGLSAPHVNRMFRELKSTGLIAVDGHKIEILDRTAMQILAEFEPSYFL